MSQHIRDLLFTAVIIVYLLVLLITQPNAAQERLKWEADAVKHGAATWSVDENGNRVFRWKEHTAHE